MEEQQFFNNAEDAQAAYNEAKAKADIDAAATQHAMVRLFEELSEDQMTSVKVLLNGCQADGSPSAFFYGGYLIAELQRRFGVCAGYGKNHDNEIANLVGSHG